MRPFFPTLFRTVFDRDPTVFEVNTVGSGRCSREVGSGSEQVRVPPTLLDKKKEVYGGLWGGRARVSLFSFFLFTLLTDKTQNLKMELQ